MLKHIWSVLCRKAIVDSSNNSLTISDVLEEVRVDVKIEKKNENVEQQIRIGLEFEIASFWQKTIDINHGAKGGCEIDLVNPSGRLMKTFREPIDMPAGMKRLRTMLRVVGFVVDGSGDYLFKIKAREEGQKTYKLVQEIPFTVVVHKEIVPDLAKAP